MNDNTTPRRMKANRMNPAPTNWTHAVEHDWQPECDIDPKCLPVDAPEPRKGKKRHEFLESEFGMCCWCGKSKEEHPEFATPPPADAPGTPVERWPTPLERNWIHIGEQERNIIERLCANLNKLRNEAQQDAQEQRTRADKLTDHIDLMRDDFLRIKACPGCNGEIAQLCDKAITNIHQWVPVIVQRDNAENERDQLKRDLAAAREREAKLREELEDCLQTWDAPSSSAFKAKAAAASRLT